MNEYATVDALKRLETAGHDTEQAASNSDSATVEPYVNAESVTQNHVNLGNLVEDALATNIAVVVHDRRLRTAVNQFLRDPQANSAGLSVDTWMAGTTLSEAGKVSATL